MTKKNLNIFRNIPTLKTDRLVLRKIKMEDLSDVHEYASDPIVPRYLLWYPHKTLSFTKAYLKYLQKLYSKGKFYDWGIEFNGKMVGTVGFTSFDFKSNSAEIGYVLGREYWGQGIATEAVREILKFAFETLDLSLICAMFLPENVQSRRVLEKCNFNYSEKKSFLVKEEYRDVEIYSLSKEAFYCNI